MCMAQRVATKSPRVRPTQLRTAQSQAAMVPRGLKISRTHAHNIPTLCAHFRFVKFVIRVFRYAVPPCQIQARAKMNSRASARLSSIQKPKFTALAGFKFRRISATGKKGVRFDPLHFWTALCPIDLILYQISHVPVSAKLCKAECIPPSPRRRFLYHSTSCYDCTLHLMLSGYLLDLY
jgi:hypothetical protein